MTNTTFKAALHTCGLSHNEAAEFLKASESAIKNWSRGKNAPPLSTWLKLAALYEKIESAANFAAETISLDEEARETLNSLAADLSTEEGLPGGADATAGALAILLAAQDQKDAIRSEAERPTVNLTDLDPNDKILCSYREGQHFREWEEPRYAVIVVGRANFCDNKWTVPIPDRKSLANWRNFARKNILQDAPHRKIIKIELLDRKTKEIIA
ncbi:MAG: helix-turn-helix transcriptional regulator [Cohaesibacter sp.]|nr:helix-turn-helix transcriptional regulator [Cohaesibacter sp.]